MSQALIAACVAASLMASRSAQASGWIDRFRESAERVASAVVKAREPRPPTPLVWKPALVANVRGVVLDAAAMDIDGDGIDELIVLAARSLTVFKAAPGGWLQIQRLYLSGAAASRRSRDAMGQLVVGSKFEEMVLRVRSSEFERGEWFSVGDGGVVSRGSFDGYPVCGDTTVRALPGKNILHTATLPKEVAVPVLSWRAVCGGRWLGLGRAHYTPVSAVDTSGRLHVRIGSGCENGVCKFVVAERGFERVGVAHAVGDLDDDGIADVALSGGGPTGEPDRVSVVSLAGPSAQVFFSGDTAQGVAVIAIGRFRTGRGRQVVVLTRALRASTAEVWLWN